MNISLFFKIGGGIMIAAAIICLVIGSYKRYISTNSDESAAEGTLTAGKVLIIISLLWLITSEIITKYLIN